MYQLQRELAVKEERFEDARQFQEHIMHEMTHNRCGTGVGWGHTVILHLGWRYRRAECGTLACLPKTLAGGVLRTTLIANQQQDHCQISDA